MARNKNSDRENGAEVVPISGAVLIARFIYLLFGVIIALILLRILLLLLAANRGNALVDFVYDFSGVFVAPFHSMFSYIPSYGVSIFEISSLIAVFVYALLMWGLAALITLGARRTEV